jgi:WD40 repeat protein
VVGYTELDVWNTMTGNSELRIELQRTNAEMNDADFSPKSDLFVYTVSGYPELSSEDGMYIYDLTAKNQIRMLVHPGATQAVFSPNGDYLVSAAHDGSVRLWNLEGYDYSEIRQADDKSITVVDFASPDVLAIDLDDASSIGNIFEYWSLKTKQQITVNDLRKASQYLQEGIAQIPLDNYSSSQLWSIFSDQDLALLRNAAVEDIQSEQNLLIAIDLRIDTRGIQFRRLDTGEVIYTISDPNLTSARLNYDGRYLILWGGEGTIEVWGVPAAK